jgi:tetratricopeptide (TPR) repeat protein
VTVSRSAKALPERKTCAIFIGIVLTLLTLAAPARAGLIEGPRLAAVYDSILNAEFNRAAAQLLEACPPAPEGACKALGAVALWWEILVTPSDRSLDERFSKAVEDAIEVNARWTAREPQSADAWFFLAGSYAPRVQWRVLRGQRLAAARDGKKIKDALERALQIDPTLYDAQFGIGLYHYYADVAPTYAKVLRWLLFLPGGDRVKGLAEMIAARDRGEIIRGEADFQLQQLYLWYEHRPDDAIALLESLDERYPNNPIFLQRIAEAEDVYVHDLDASARAWETLRDRAREGRVYAADVIAARAEEKLRAIATRRVKLF